MIRTKLSNAVGCSACRQTIAAWSRLFSRSAINFIKVGDKIPSIDLFEELPSTRINTAKLMANKKVVLFGVPGAFTPACSRSHLPGFVNESGDLKSKNGVDEVICIAINDPFVMSAWGKEHNCRGRVRMLADPMGTFTRAVDLGVYIPQLGGLRTQRFSMIVDNGIVKELNVEPDGVGLTVTTADQIGKRLFKNAKDAQNKNLEPLALPFPNITPEKLKASNEMGKPKQAGQVNPQVGTRDLNSPKEYFDPFVEEKLPYDPNEKTDNTPKVLTYESEDTPPPRYPF